MIIIVLGLLILAYSFYDFKKAYYGFIVYIIFWAPQAFCFKIGNKDVIINMVMSLGLFISFILNYKRINTTKKLMPFTIPFILMIVSMLLTCFFAKAGFKLEITRALSKVLQTYTTIYISWYVFETREDFKKLINLIIISFFIACIYGIVEFIIQKNIYVDYKRSISTNMLPPYITSTRGYRIISIFDHPVGAGLNFGLIAAFILYLYIYEKDILTHKKFSLITSVLCIICVILTKQRGNYLFLLILLIPCLNPKRINLKKVIISIILLFIISLPITYKRLNIILSIFDDESQSEIKGSTIEMRLDQLDAIEATISESPIFGNGEKYDDYISKEMKDRIKGPESIWLEQLVKHGILGVIVNVIFMVYSVVIVPYKYKTNIIFFLFLAYWITYSITTFLSFRFDLYYCILFYYIKTSNIYINQQSDNN